jgi:predicted aspartyl protease
MLKSLTLACLLFCTQINANAQNSGCNCFLIKETKGKLSIEKTVIDNNNVQVFNNPEIVAPVFSMGEGMNGDMVQKERRGGMIIAQCKDNLLKLKFRNQDGTEKPLPDMDITALRQVNVRLNIIGGDGNKSAFIIEHYDLVKTDNGPVIDMFGGKLPVKPGDFIITTETKRPTNQNSLAGGVPFRISNEWIVVSVGVGAGRQADFVVDLAATTSVIDKAFLPSGIPVKKLEMVEYSAGTENKKDATMQGATGTVNQNVFAGRALLEAITLGGIEIRDVNVSVLNSFPDKLRKAGIVGIIGTDILMRSGNLSIQSLNKEKGILHFGHVAASLVMDLEIPFTIAGGLIFAEGAIGSFPISYLLDTGARETILSQSFAQEHKLDYLIVDQNKTITGIDGTPVNVHMVNVPTFSIGKYAFTNKKMIVGDIAAISSFGLQKSSAILGMDFFRQFDYLELDFNQQRVRLKK